MGLPNIKKFGTLSPIPGFADWFSFQDDKKIENILGTLKNKDASFLKSKDLMMKLATHYIVNEKNKKGLPVNDVSRFHLGNGAIVDDIIVNANISEVGYERSFGVMVNYL